MQSRTSATSALSAAVSEAIGVLGKSVVPLYVDRDGAPSLLGSGFFLRHGSSNLLVSAAHVLETLRTEHVYYYAAPAMKRRITGRLTLNTHEGSRDSDLLDLGAVNLEGPAQPPYPEVDKYAIDTSYLTPPPAVTMTARYGFIGFPASRSRVRHGPSEVRVEPYAYFGGSVPLDEYAQDRLDPSSHLCMSFDKKKSFDLQGKGRAFPKPHGISGSPIFYLYDDSDDNQAGSFKLAGIVTTWRAHSRRVFGPGSLAIAELARVAA